MNFPVSKKFDGYFLPETTGRIQKIKDGNGSDVIRDMSMRKREYFETRPSPAKPHHWLATEFEQFLLTHNYPSNTLRDRMRNHALSIRAALMQGEAVPEIVLKSAEGISAIDEAVMEVASLDYGSFLEAQTSHARQLFEVAVSRRAMTDSSVDPLQEILLEAVRLAAEQEACGVSPNFMVAWHDRPLRVFQSDDSTYFFIQDAGWNRGAVSGVVSRIDRAQAEVWVAKAMNQGTLRFDDMLWLMRDRSAAGTKEYMRMGMRG